LPWCCFLPGSTGAQGLVEGLRSHLGANWEQAKRAAAVGDWTLYASGYAWHAPWRYSPKQREGQNEAAWGGGFGRHVFDDAGDYHGLYGLAFLDSNREPMYMAGYNWQTYWGGRDLKVGLGYTLFLFGRSDYSNYVPLPGVLPVVSIRYSRFEILGAYVPSLPSLGLDRGDVALFIGRLNF
jgi:palmitoyl transferase